MGIRRPPAILTNSVTQTAVGATIGTANGSALTNLSYIWVTNAVNTGNLPLGRLLITNLTGNITITGFSDFDDTRGCTYAMLAIADGSTRTVALPAYCFSTDGARTYYVTNGTARMFQFSVTKVWTNCACVPSF